MRGKTALAGLGLAVVLASAAQAATPDEQATGFSPAADPRRIGAPAGTASGELVTLTGVISKNELGYRLTTEEGRSYLLDVSDAQRDLDELVGGRARLTGMIVAEAPAASSGTSAGTQEGQAPETVGVIRVKDVETIEGEAKAR